MYEVLIKEAGDNQIHFVEIELLGKIKGLYSDNVIAINANIPTKAEKTCILAEELGHYYTSFGDIIDQDKIENIKQEKRARAWSYEKLMSVLDIINAYKNNVTNRFELAEYLDVTEEFIEDAINYYYNKHGSCCNVGNYVVYFNPLAVMEIF